MFGELRIEAASIDEFSRPLKRFVVIGRDQAFGVY
jgi:hypothetical protein